MLRVEIVDTKDSFSLVGENADDLERPGHASQLRLHASREYLPLAT